MQRLQPVRKLILSRHIWVALAAGVVWFAWNLISLSQSEMAFPPGRLPFFGLGGEPLLLSLAIPVLLVLILIPLQLQGGLLSLFGFGSKRDEAGNYAIPETTLNDVGGDEDAKRELCEVLADLKHSRGAAELESQPSRGVLISGPAGVGKTWLAKAVAGEAGVPLIQMDYVELMLAPAEERISRLQALVEQARRRAPAVVLFDGLDSIGPLAQPDKTLSSEAESKNRFQLAAVIGTLEGIPGIVVLATAHLPKALPSPFLKKQFFPQQISLGLPDREEREQILKIQTRRLSLAPDVNLALIARTTCGLNGAALASIITQSSLAASRRNQPHVHMADFEEALDAFLLGPGRTALISEIELQVAAAHEAGHALVAWLTPQAEPIRKVGLLQPCPLENNFGPVSGISEAGNPASYTREKLMACLAVILAGRAAEEIAFGEATTHSWRDLIDATALARQMISSWGMSSLGLAAFDNRELSEETARCIDREVQGLLEERYRYAREKLAEAQDRLELLTQTLLQEETVGREKLNQILGKRSFNEEVIALRELEIPHQNKP